MWFFWLKIPSYPFLARPYPSKHVTNLSDNFRIFLFDLLSDLFTRIIQKDTPVVPLFATPKLSEKVLRKGGSVAKRGKLPWNMGNFGGKWEISIFLWPNLSITVRYYPMLQNFTFKKHLLLFYTFDSGPNIGCISGVKDSGPQIIVFCPTVDNFGINFICSFK